MNLSKKFASIYIPYGSFMLVSKAEQACQALDRFYNHLLPEGRLIIFSFIPTKHDIHVAAPEQNKWRLRREGNLNKNTTIKCWRKPALI